MLPNVTLIYGWILFLAKVFGLTVVGWWPVLGILALGFSLKFLVNLIQAAAGLAALKSVLKR